MQVYSVCEEGKENEENGMGGHICRRTGHTSSIEINPLRNRNVVDDTLRRSSWVLRRSESLVQSKREKKRSRW